MPHTPRFNPYLTFRQASLAYVSNSYYSKTLTIHTNCFFQHFTFFFNNFFLLLLFAIVLFTLITVFPFKQNTVSFYKIILIYT